MEIIHNLLNSTKDNICFLCLKENANTHNVRSYLEVQSETFNESLTLAEMIVYLFPSFELTTTRACNNCSDLIIKMYIIIHRNNIMKRVLSSVIDTINKEITKSTLPQLDNYRKLDILINLTKILKQSFKCSQKYDLTNTRDEKYDEYVTNKSEEKLRQENQCPNCYKLFDSVKKFKTHMKSHNRKRKTVEYICSHCKYVSTSKQSLQGHINKKHLKVKPYVCNICYKHYYHKKNLVEHEKIHSQIRNEICDVCGDSFVHKKNLLEHLKLHSGEKPYPCEVCSRRFITSGRRLEHMKRCHSEKKECCVVCDKRFSLIKELTRHIKTVHS